MVETWVMGGGEGGVTLCKRREKEKRNGQGEDPCTSKDDCEEEDSSAFVGNSQRALINTAMERTRAPLFWMNGRGP